MTAATQQSRRAVVPETMATDESVYGFASAHVAGGFVFVSGQLGFDAKGALPDNGEEQAHHAFSRLRLVLEEAGASAADVVSLTTYHVGALPEVNEWFLDVKRPLFSAPLPAWTQVEVASLAVPNALIEIAAIAFVGV